MSRVRHNVIITILIITFTSLQAEMSDLSPMDLYEKLAAQGDTVRSLKSQKSPKVSLTLK